MENSAEISLQIALLLGLGALCQWAAWRMRLPAILPLLLSGLLLGPALGVLDPDAFLGNLLFPLVSLGVAVILFEGSLTLRFSELRGTAGIIRNLTSVGVAVTWIVMAVAAHQIAGLSWPMAALFGALVTVTGPTVIVPMLRSIRPTARIANILRWEGILIDPIGAVLVVLVFEFIKTGQEQESLIQFAKVVTIGTVWGIASGWAAGQVLKRHLLPDYLVNYALLAFLLTIYAASNSLGQESGLVAVTVMGIVLANTTDLDVEDILSFKEHLTVVLISVLFILLAARLEVDAVASVIVPGLGLLAVALFVARPLSVLVSSIGTNTKKNEIALLSWVAPRGIVAAAVSALFALKLEGIGYPEAQVLVPLTFLMIIGTVVIQSLTAGWLAQRLGLSSRGEQGVLMIGANRVALMLGEALMGQGIKVKVVDTRREGLREARMRGMETFYGNPLSEYADRHMDLTGYTHLLAVSQNPEANAVVCDRFRHEFGSGKVFAIQPGSSEAEDERKGFVYGLRANLLFSRGVSWTKLASLVSQGAELRATGLTEKFDAEAFAAEWGGDAIPLFAIDANGKLHVRTASGEMSPEAGWTVISLVTDPRRKEAPDTAGDQGGGAQSGDSGSGAAPEAAG